MIENEEVPESKEVNNFYNKIYNFRMQQKLFKKKKKKPHQNKKRKSSRIKLRRKCRIERWIRKYLINRKSI